VRVLFLGDSITAGYPSINGWRGDVCLALRGSGAEIVGPLEDASGLQHAGFHGQRLDFIFDHLMELLSLKPDCVVLQCGGNGLPDEPPERIGALTHAIAVTCLANGVSKFFVCTITDVLDYSSDIDAYNAAIRDACIGVDGAKVLEVGHHLGRVSQTSSNFCDEAHPSGRGYRILATLIARGAFGVDIETPHDAHFGAEAASTKKGLFELASAALLEAYPTMPAPVRQMALGIGWTESGFGQSGSWAPDGVPSNNWGALTYVAGRSPRYIEHGDHKADGTPVTYKFAAFATLTDGAIAWYETWAKPDTLEAARRGDVWGVALAMKRHGYYTGTKGDEYDRVLAYARMLMAGATLAATNLGEKLAVYLSPPAKAIATGASKPFSFANLGVLAVTGAIFFGTLAMKARRLP
jgi:lysophospholipase L1-like esterase